MEEEFQIDLEKALETNLSFSFEEMQEKIPEFEIVSAEKEE